MIILEVAKIVKKNIFLEKATFRLKADFSVARVGARRRRNYLFFCAEIDHKAINQFLAKIYFKNMAKIKLFQNTK